MMRQFLFDAVQVPWLTALQGSSDDRVAGIAAKSLKEALYHLDRSAETVVMLGDGTEESHARMQSALDRLWPYAREVFVADDVDRWADSTGVAPLPETVRPTFDATVATTLAEATLTLPEGEFAHHGGRTGARHSEHLGHMLATMQVLPRSYPDARW